jgi:hypothetical protein
VNRLIHFVPFLLFSLLQVASPRASEAQPLANNPSGFIRWDAKAQGQFVTALCSDRRGVLWVGTEDKGLYRRAVNGTWTHFSAEDGVGDDNIRCLAIDTKNRLWVGTGRGGVSVWNGEKWRNFSVFDGPLSERVRDIAISPQNGEIWMATEAGLSRYSDENGWRYSTRLDGLSSDQIVALAFDAQSNLFVATACDGLSIGHAADDYAQWENVYGLNVQPTVPQGKNLPSSQLNDVAVENGGTVWVATNYGIAKSDDKGKSWFFLRGKDWKQNVEGSQLSLKPQVIPTGAELLEEDWINKIEPTADGQIWVGYRRHGFELRDGSQGDLIYTWRDAKGDMAIEGDSVSSILPLKGGAVVGSYGSGVQLTTEGGRNTPEFEVKAEPNEEVPLPSLPALATSLSRDEMKALVQRVAALPATQGAVGGFYGVDWRTRGNWVGRYGDRYATLYGMQFPTHHELIRSPDLHKVAPEQVGRHGNKVGPYTYLHELQSDNPGVLYDPVVGKRRPAEINDGGWQGNLYPPSWDGPDLWVPVEVPAGTQRVALYFHNFPGHDGSDRFRDYVVHLKPFSANPDEAEIAPDLATARIKDFWSGGYLQFWVRGPGKFMLKIASGNSHVTILQATLLDQIRGAKSPADNYWMPWMGEVRYVTEETPAPATDENDVVAAARELWNASEENGAKPRAIEAAWMMRLQAYRAAAAAGASEALLANWRWKLAIWDESDEAGFQNTMGMAYKKQQEQIAARKAAAPAPEPAQN